MIRLVTLVEGLRVDGGDAARDQSAADSLDESPFSPRPARKAQIRATRDGARPMVDQRIERAVAPEAQGDVVGRADGQHGQRNVVAGHLARDRGDRAVTAHDHDQVRGAIEEPLDAEVLVHHLHDVMAVALDPPAHLRRAGARAGFVVVEHRDVH